LNDKRYRLEEYINQPSVSADFKEKIMLLKKIGLLEDYVTGKLEKKNPNFKL
jgi:hypothetical protein